MDGSEVRVVKGIIMLALMLLTGCAGYTPLKQLEAQALLSGDWSFVEKRERMETRRNLQSNMQCPPGTMGYCETYRSPDRCSCIDSKIIRSFLDKF